VLQVQQCCFPGEPRITDRLNGVGSQHGAMAARGRRSGPNGRPRAAGETAPLDTTPPVTVRSGMHEGVAGWIEVISGVMFSGKSEELMRRVRRAVLARKRVQVFKSSLDNRYGIDAIASHDGGRIQAEPIQSALELMEKVRPDTEVVAVDEVQFLDDDIVDAANALADRGVRVILAGTDMDFRGRPFGPIPALLAIAEKVDKLHAICVRCGELATRNQRLINGKPAPAEGPTIQVGGLESYEARCRRCHEVPSEAHAQTSLLE